MKKYGLLLGLVTILTTSLAQAVAPDTFALNGRAQAIGSDTGYALGISTPYLVSDTALAFDYSFSRGGSGVNYSMAHVSLIKKLAAFGKYSPFMRSGIYSATPDSPLFLQKYGISYSVGTKIEVNSERFLFQTEVGWYFPFSGLDNRAIAQGAGVSLGFAFHL